jgi:hypothetical protein
VSLVHELKELVDDRLEELPMGLQKSRVLANDVHDVGSDDGLVVLASLHLGKTEKLLDDGDQKAFLRFLVCAMLS